MRTTRGSESEKEECLTARENERDETRRGQDKTETVAVNLREPVRTRPYHPRNFDPEGFQPTLDPYKSIPDHYYDDPSTDTRFSLLPLYLSAFFVVVTKSSG